MNKRRRYKAKHRRRWALLVRLQMDSANAWTLQAAQQISAAIARGMGIQKRQMWQELKRRGERWV